MYTMVYKVVSTKLTEEVHDKMLDVCNKEGLTPSALIKESIMMRIHPEYLMAKIIEMMDTDVEFFGQVTDKIQQKNKPKPIEEWNLEDLKKAFGIK